MNRRPTHGDGLTPTSSLEPCRCPSCGEDLEVTCPNRCAKAHEGAQVGLTPAQAAAPPRRNHGRVADRVEAALRTQGALTAKDVAALLDCSLMRAHTQLHYMAHTGRIRRVGRGLYAQLEGTR